MDESRTIGIQGIGRKPAVKVSTLKPGDTLMWNYGETSVVKTCDLIAGTNTYRLVLQNPTTGRISDIRKRGNTLVAKVVR